MAPTSSDPTLPGSDDERGIAPGGRWGRYVVLGELGSGGMGLVLAAHDPALDRKVALKLLAHPYREWNSAGAARIEREAQAMARLAHPNVVTVFEVDRIGDQAFVAMELVEGSTLRGWVCERPRSWREVVAMFIAAGRGLAAAHAAGLVHRDFKPDNVLIGGDGRPRVSDFGLVVDTSGEMPVTAPAAHGDDLTTRGTLAGTPAYMSPEQWTGDAVDARADQFAFCVALWEALWGVRPFRGATPAELRAAVHAGALSAPPRRPRTPQRLVTALRRGLAVDREARWPDMTSLVDELARTLGARQRRAVAGIVSATAIASAAIAATIMGARDAPDRCAAPTAQLAAVWNPARRDALGARLSAIDPGEGRARFATIAAALDLGARRWSAMHVEACRATYVENRQSELLLDRRMACLDRWLGELTDTVGVIERAGDRAEIDQSVRASAALSPLAGCADARVLSEALPPPTGVAERATATALLRRTQELEVEQRAGKILGLPVKVRAVVDAARRLDHAPTLVAALAVRARVDFAVDDATDADVVLRELVQVAARARDDQAAAFAWTNLIFTLDADEARPAEAAELVPMATAAVLRAGDPPDLRADLLYTQAGLDIKPGRPDARRLLAEARRVLEQAGAASAGSPLASRLIKVIEMAARVHLDLGEHEAGIASYREVIERWRALYGPDSPDEAIAWHNLATGLDLAGERDEALAAYRRALAIREARLGESTATAFSSELVAMALHTRGRWSEALEAHDQAIRAYRAHLAPDDRQLIRTRGNRAETLGFLGRFDEAARAYDEILAELARIGPKAPDLPVMLHGRGELERRRGRCPDAVRDFARAIALGEELEGPGAPSLLHPLIGSARCLLRAGRLDDAAARAERALRLPSYPTDAFEIALARSYLGRVRVETRRDVAGGLAMARSARTALAAASDATNAEDVRELDAWLAAHGR